MNAWVSLVLKQQKHLLRSVHVQCRRLFKTDQDGEPAIMKILNVAEKNDAAKNISYQLSRGTSQMRQGFSKYNKIYEFNCNVRGQNANMVMTSVSGHLLALDFGGQYKNWRGCNPVALFDAPVIKFCPEQYQDIKRTLEREVRSCQMLIIWTDCDREGENIGFEIIEVCQAIKPNIQVLRARFSEITLPSVQRAINTLEPPNQLLSAAVSVRSELDLRIGAAFTRFQTLRLQQVFPNKLKDQLISYGSCQFPTLGFVVERYKAIERFIPEPFWKIVVSHTVGDLTVTFSWKRVRLFDELACQVLLDVAQEHSGAVVEKVVSKPKSKWRPLPLDTVELEKLGSKKLRMNAKTTMMVAERLYTQGFISYPRTETNIFPPSMNLANIVQQQTQDDRWGEFAQNVLQDGPNPRKGKKSDEAHPPIHPTKHTNNLAGDEKKVYEFIVRHFLACCSKDAEGHETIVDIDVNGEKFVASGLRIIARNYLDVYPYENWKGKEIHPYEEGQRFQPTTIEMGSGETNAPNLLTEADLIALMEKHGIGTDATHAEHIETIKNRQYVGVDRTYFLPGKLGLGLVDGYDSMGFAMSKPNLRAELEADLQRIADGIRNPQEVLAEQVQNYKRVFEEAMVQAAKIDAALADHLEEERQPATENIVTVTFKKVCSCPLCGQDMVIRERKNGAGFYITCMGFPTCRTSVWFPESVDHADVSDQVCGDCNMRPQKIIFKFKSRQLIQVYGQNYVGCVGGCDTNLVEALSVRPLKDFTNRNTQSDNSQDSGFGSSGNSSFNNRSGPRGGGNQSSSGARGSSNSTRGNQSTFGARGSSNSTRGNQSTFGARGSSNSTRGNQSTFGARGANNSNSGPFQRRQSTNVGDDAIVCKCNVDAIQLTVRKDGPNQGRPFYKCGNNSSCDFFMWADEGQGPPEGGRNEGNSRQTTLSNFSNVNDDFNDGGGGGGGVSCECGEPARSLTVQKDGPNKGRGFYGCAKPMQSKCNFFAWADGEGSSGGGGGGGRGRGSGRGRGGGSSWRGGGGSGSSSGNRGGNAGNSTRAKRKCGNCGQEGHTRPKCPNV